MDCIYLVPIPKDMTMKVIFEKFSMEYTDEVCTWVIVMLFVAGHFTFLRLH